VLKIKGKALAGKSTLNRLELTLKPWILFIDLFLESYQTPPKEIILDVDTNKADPLQLCQRGI